jgi:hypothetical protein
VRRAVRRRFDVLEDFELGEVELDLARQIVAEASRLHIGDVAVGPVV